MEQRKRLVTRQSSSRGRRQEQEGALFGRPDSEFPDLPDDITDLPDEDLMVLFTEYVGWQNYAASELSAAEVREARTESNLKYTEAQAMALYQDPKAKVTVARAEISLSEDVLQAREQVLVAYAHRKLSQVVYENCERCAQLCSRELSRRIGRDPLERRQMRWNP